MPSLKRIFGKKPKKGAAVINGSLQVETLFLLSNNFFQNDAEGICTAASLNWCMRCLKKFKNGKSFEVTKEDELVLDSHTLNAQMAVLRRKDNDASDQCALSGLIPVNNSDIGVSSILEAAQKIKNSQSHIGIFWNDYHTMALLYEIDAKGIRIDFFDQNNGVFRATNEQALAAKYKELYPTPQDEAIGCRPVALPD